MKKNLTLMAVLFGLIFTMALPVGAASQTVCETKTVTTMCGDIEIEETLVVYSVARSNTKSASKHQTYRDGGRVIAEVTLNATFGYDGKTAWVVSANTSRTTYSGWTYGSESISKSGNTASASAMLRHSNSYDTPVNISMTCSPSGSIS
ncbi:hypothetical protein AALA82_04380 [Oscillospiraceae bacterium 50-16]